MVQNNTKNHESQCQYPSRSSKRCIPSLSIQGQYPSRRSKRDRVASLVLMLHQGQGNTLYKRSNSFTTIVLQRLKIQEQESSKTCIGKIEVSLILPS
jgi:hypothetical protein